MMLERTDQHLVQLANRDRAIEDALGRRVPAPYADGHTYGRSARSNIRGVDGKHALVSDLAAGELVIVDVAARRAIKRIALGKAPEGIVIEPSGARAFVAVNGDNFIAVIDLNSFTVTGKLTPGNGPDGMAWVGR